MTLNTKNEVRLTSMKEKNDIRDVGSTADLVLVFLVHWYILTILSTALHLLVEFSCFFEAIPG